jgi:hypothetical protein
LLARQINKCTWDQKLNGCDDGGKVPKFMEILLKCSQADADVRILRRR